MKRIFIIVPVILVTLLAVVVVAPSFIDWSMYKTEAQKQIKNFTGYDVEFKGDVAFAVLPQPMLYVKDVEVKAPAGSTAGHLAKLERLEANLALAPLFSGEIVVSSVELVKPDIALEVLKGGQGNWMTPELELLMNAKDAAGAQPSEGGAASVSLENIVIEDGRFSYRADGKLSEIADVSLNIKADTLQGPFDVKGSLSFAGAPVQVEAKIGALGKGASSISLNLAADYNGVGLAYAGAVGLKAPFEVQGETAIGVKSLASVAKNFGVKDVNLASEPASLKGLLTASTEKLSFKNAALEIAGHKMSADFSTTLSPLYVSGAFKSSDTFNLDKIMPAGGGSSSEPLDITALDKFLPETLSLPASFGADVRVSLPSMIFQNQIYNNVALSLSKKDKSFQVKADIEQVPGKGKVTAGVDLSFAEKTVSQKTGAEIYSGPVLSFAVKAALPDLPFTAKALSVQDTAIGFKSASFEGSGSLRPGKLQLGESVIVLDNQSYKVSGALEGHDLLMNLGALGGQVIAKGQVQKGMTLKDTALQIKHPNLAKALQELSGASTQNSMLAQPLDFYTVIDQDGGAYVLKDIKAKLGQASVSGSLKFDGSGAKPSLSGDLGFGDLVLQSQSGASAATQKTSTGTNSSVRWSKDKIDTSWMGLADVDLSIKANSIKYESWDLYKPRLKFSLKDSVLDIADLGAGLYDGQIDFSGQIKPVTAGVHAKGKSTMVGINMEPLVKSLAGNQIIKGQGSIDLAMELDAVGGSQADLVSGLAGQGTVGGSKLVLEGIDLNRFARALSDEAKPGDSLLHLWKGATSGGSTSFDTLDGSFSIEKGIVTIAKLDLDGPRGAIATTGKINLPAWTVQTAHTMSVKDRDDVPEFTVNISGSLDNPAQTFAQGAIQDYLKRKLSRKLEKVMNDKLGEKLNDKLGGELGGVIGNLLGGGSATTNTAPAPANDNAAPQEQPQDGQVTPEKAFEGLLKNLVH